MHQLSIAKRLWLNLSIAIMIAVAIASGGMNGLDKAQDSSDALIALEADEVNPIETFSQDFNRSMDQMMAALLVRTPQNLEVFMSSLEDQRQRLATIMADKGIEIEKNSDGFYRPVEKETKSESEIDSAQLVESEQTGQATDTSEAENAPKTDKSVAPLTVDDFLQIDPVLVNLEKAVQSYLFLRKDIENTYEFGVETSVKTMQAELTTLLASDSAQESQTLQANLAQWQQRLEESKKLAVMLVASGDFEYFDQFHQTGLGDAADALVEPLNEELSGNFLLQESLQSFINSRDSLYESFQDIRSALQTAESNNQMISSLVSEGQAYFENVLAFYQAKRLESLQELETVATERFQWMLWIAVIGLAAMIFINLLFIRSINRPIAKMQQQVEQVQQTMKFDQWQTSKGNNELVGIEHSIQKMLQTFAASMQEVVQSSQAMANGDLTKTVSTHYQGDLLQMAEHFNRSLHGVQDILNEIEQISQALAHGNLDYQIEVADYPGQYQMVMQQLQQALTEQKHAIDEVKDISQAMEQGNFSKRIESVMPGDLGQLKTHLNHALNNLESAITDKVVALEAYSSGDFSFEMQGDYQGHLLELKGHMKSMAKKISRMLKDVHQSTQQAENGVKEISQGNQELNQRVQKQSGFIQKTSQQMGTMVRFLEGSFEQSTQMSQVSEAVKKESNSAKATIEEMVLAMQEIQQASQ